MRFCGTPAPVLLKRIGSGAAKVEVSPPAVLNCGMVASLHAWVEKILAADGARGARHLDCPPAQCVRLCLPRAQRPSARHRQAERACVGRCHRHRRLCHGRWPHHRRGALLGSRRARDKVAAAQAQATKIEPAKKDAGKPEPTEARQVSKKISAIAHRLHEEKKRSRPGPGSRTPSRRAKQRGGGAASGQGHVRRQCRSQGHSRNRCP